MHHIVSKLLRRVWRMANINIEEFNTIKEGKAIVLTPKEDKVFYNPIQQFNRDLSVMGIKAWTELYLESKAGEREKAHKKRKLENGTEDSNQEEKPFIKILEALSATGLRAIRYGHEIPKVSKIVANDLLPEAVKSIDRNIEYNGLQDKVCSNLGDAIKFMSTTTEKFHVIDLDPYGTATPFIDSAIQGIKDEGLLLVTCTDAGVLAGSGYPEKCFALYGGHNFGNSNVSTEANHEAGIRLILNMIATNAAKYKKTIEPLLSLSIDFYFRLFIRVKTSPIEVKQLASKTMLTYYCTGCGDKVNQPLGRVIDNGKQNKKFQVPKLVNINSKCDYCESNYNIAGPMWFGELQNNEFIDQVLKINMAADKEVYCTTERIKGMLTLAKNEMELPFYFNLNQLSSLFKSPPIPINDFCRSIGNMGYNVSLTHAKKNCIKTDAPWDVILKINKQWLAESNKALLKTYEQKLIDTPENENLKSKINFYRENIDGNPNLTSGMVGYKILKNLKDDANDKVINFTDDNEVSQKINKLRHLKMVRYQENPTKNWGPKARPGK